jgi:hypothetical protein
MGKDPQAAREVRRATRRFAYYAAVRPLFAAALVSAAGLLIVGCSAGGQGSGSTTSTTTPASAKPSASASPSSSPTAVNVSAPSAPSSSGKLRVRLRAAFPVQSSAFMTAIAAEAPDGSVFAAFSTQQNGTPSAPAGSAVYVVDGNGPVQVAEHPSIPVSALAADSTYLYVGGGNQIIEYARSSGSIARTVSLPLPVRVMAVSAGKLWAVLGSLTGSGQIVEITPGSGAMTTVGTDSANVVDVAAGPLGLYYVESGGATIVRVNPNGTHLEASTNQTVSQQLSGPAAIQAISVLGSQLLVIHDAGQGLDSSSQTYDATTLAGPQNNASGIAGSNHAVDTLAGPMDASAADGSACSGKACVGRYNVATGAVTDAVTFPQNVHLSTLLGPYPAVIVFPASGHVYLDRVG